MNRRLLLMAGLALLAGCASPPAPRAPTGTVGRREPAAPMPASRAPLDIDPGEREAAVAQAMLLVNTVAAARRRRGLRA